MLKKFFKKEKKNNQNNNILIAALLIHAAKIDENYSEIEKKIITKGERGIIFYEVDAFGRELGYVKDLEPTDPEPGLNIITTLDLDIQYFIEGIMKNRKGVILVGLGDSGEILGAVSAPDFDPELFTGLILETTWNEIRNNSRYISHGRLP